MLAALAAVLLEFLVSDGLKSFSSFGINSVIANVAAVGAIIIFFARLDTSGLTGRNLVLIYAVVTGIGFAIALMLLALSMAFPQIRTAVPQTRIGLAIIVLWSVCVLVWMTGATRQAFKLIPAVRRPTLRALAFTFCLFLSGIVLPTWPTFLPPNFDKSTANVWEVATAFWAKRAREANNEDGLAKWRREQQEAVRIEGRQPRMLDAALASVESRDPAGANIFLLGVAGWGSEDVFEHETEQSIAILKSRFDIGRRTISLVNADDTIDRYPLASIQNLSFALRAIGARMDREKDVLILTMTSHGSQDGFALQFGDLIYRTLDPATLRTLLDEAGIKNRILIIAACYSGVFVPILKNDNTMIVTAASATRTSFGCASGRKWTYFGDAFFDHGLKRERTLAAAFGRRVGLSVSGRRTKS